MKKPNIPKPRRPMPPPNKVIPDPKKDKSKNICREKVDKDHE